MKYLSQLKTSEKISLSFSFFGVLSLILFLILVNITYFFIWYADQKEKSFSDMNHNYYAFQKSEATGKDIEDFKKFLLMQDTMIIPQNGELICSPGVSQKIKEAPEEIQDRHFYRDGDTTYFIYSRYFDGIGDVRVFFDTTPYIKSQIIIIKIGFLFIILVSIFQFFAGKIISKRLLSDLKSISQRVQKIDIHTPSERINCFNTPPDDEIHILATALNTSYDTIQSQTQKLKQFLTDVSHEFKTPLMVLSSRLDLLEKKDEKNSLEHEDIQKFFLDTRSNIQKLNSLLESLFFLSRIEEQQSCLIKKPLALRDFCEKRILHISDRFAYKELDYTLDIDTELMIEVEENTFSILLDNLISNAMKFAPEHMRIDISYKNDTLIVADNGPGIETSERKKIWEKFYRKDTNREGFGVGLYLVKRIVDIYAWSISVSSRKGKGTKFKVSFTGKK